MKCEQVLPDGSQCKTEAVNRPDVGHTLCDEHYADCCKVLNFHDKITQEEKKRKKQPVQ